MAWGIFQEITDIRVVFAWVRVFGIMILVIALVIALGTGGAIAQTFDSGSTGADGALDFSSSPPGTVIDFDPTTFNPLILHLIRMVIVSTTSPPSPFLPMSLSGSVLIERDQRRYTG